MGWGRGVAARAGVGLGDGVEGLSTIAQDGACGGEGAPRGSGAEHTPGTGPAAQHHARAQTSAEMPRNLRSFATHSASAEPRRRMHPRPPHAAVPVCCLPENKWNSDACLQPRAAPGGSPAPSRAAHPAALQLHTAAGGEGVRQGRSSHWAGWWGACRGSGTAIKCQQLCCQARAFHSLLLLQPASQASTWQSTSQAEQAANQRGSIGARAGSCSARLALTRRYCCIMERRETSARKLPPVVTPSCCCACGAGRRWSGS